MHELRIAQDLSVIVIDAVSNKNLSKVTKVNIIFGQLVQIVPDIFEFAFREASAVLLNKIDLIPYTNFNLESFKADLKSINSQIPLFESSAFRGDGMSNWYKWITTQIAGAM